MGVISVCGMLGYAFLGCDDVSPVHGLETTSVVANASCSIDCHCDYVSNAPVCGDDGITYLSACHAGCTSEGSSVFGNCSCVESVSVLYIHVLHMLIHFNVFYNILRSSPLKRPLRAVVLRNVFETQ